MRLEVRVSALVIGLSSSLMLIGCGDSAPKPSADAGGTVIAPGNAAVADPGKPADADKLAGTWYRTEDAASAADDVIGVEFAADGKLAILGRPMGGQAPQEMAVKYTKLENGRIRLATDASAAVSQVVQCNLNGDTLTITPETRNAMLGFDGGTFTRLPAGKTIVARYAERIKERQAEAAKLAEQLTAFLNQPNLAIVPADAGGVGSLRVALNVKPNAGTWAGTGQMTVANTTVERQVQLNVAPNAQPPTVTCTLGPVIGPAGAKPMQGESFQFAASMKDGTLSLRDNQMHALRPDADATAKLAADYAANVKKQRDLLDAFHATLGALVLAEGDPQPNQPRLRAALLRVPDKDQYLLAVYRGSEASLLPTSFTIPHVVMLQDDKAILVNPQTRQILDVTGSGDARAFAGNFNGTNATLRITRSMTLDQLKARQADIRTFLDSLKATPLALVGQFYQSYPYEMGYVRPVRLDLTSADGKALAGTFHADTFGLDLPIGGEVVPTLLGMQVKFAVAKVTPPLRDRFDEGGTFTADVALVDGKPTLVGRVSPGDGNSRLDLAPVDPARTAALRKQFDDAVAKGGAFKWARTGSTGSGTDVMTLTLQPGDDTGKLVGTAGFRKTSAPITGTIAEDRGQLVIDLVVPETPPKTVAAGTMRLYVLPYGDAFYLSGSRTWKAEPNPSFACYGPQ